jgi:hypothetical protein
MNTWTWRCSTHGSRRRFLDLIHLILMVSTILALISGIQYFSFPYGFHLESTGIDQNPQEYTRILRNRLEFAEIDQNLEDFHME